MIKIWCIDINAQVSLILSFSATPRQGHLGVVLYIMGYLKLTHNFRLAFDPSYLNIDHSKFQKCDWTDFFEGAVEAIPCNAPLSRGKEVNLCMFVDSNYAGDKWTKTCKTGFMIFMNMSLIIRYSNKQCTIETSVFGAKYVVMKVAVDTLHVIQ